jgi:hypothetical protein
VAGREFALANFNRDFGPHILVLEEAIWIGFFGETTARYFSFFGHRIAMLRCIVGHTARPRKKPIESSSKV